MGIWKSGGFGLGRWDLGIALPKKILGICVRQFSLWVLGIWREIERERERGVIEYIEKL